MNYELQMSISLSLYSYTDVKMGKEERNTIYSELWEGYQNIRERRKIERIISNVIFSASLSSAILLLSSLLDFLSHSVVQAVYEISYHCQSSLVWNNTNENDQLRTVTQ